jgi:ABC-2 type transport system ATP-binding protein
LRRLGDEGRTVVVSSHLLSEVEAACDSLAVIRYGELLFSGPLADLVAKAGECIEAVPEHPQDVDPLARSLVARGWKATARGDDVRVAAPASEAADVNRAAAQAGITLRALRPHEASLEEVFLRMTGESSGDNGRPVAEDGGEGGGAGLTGGRSEKPEVTS